MRSTDRTFIMSPNPALCKTRVGGIRGRARGAPQTEWSAVPGEESGHHCAFSNGIILSLS